MNPCRKDREIYRSHQTRGDELRELCDFLRETERAGRGPDWNAAIEAAERAVEAREWHGLAKQE